MPSHRSLRIVVALLAAVLSAACAPEPPPPPPPQPTIEEPRLAYPADEVTAALTTAAGPLGAITDQPDEQRQPRTRVAVNVEPCATVAYVIGGSSTDFDAMVYADGLLTQDMAVGAASDEVPGVTAQLAVHHLGSPGEANAVLAKARMVSCVGGATNVVSGLSVEGYPAAFPFSTLVHAAQSVTPLLGEEDRAILVRTQLDGELDDDVTHPVLHGEGRLIVVHGPLVVDIAVLVAGPASADESGRLADEARDQALELVQSFLGELGH